MPIVGVAGISFSPNFFSLTYSKFVCVLAGLCYFCFSFYGHSDASASLMISFG